MKNIHVLPTDKPSRLYKSIDNELSFTDIEFEQGGFNKNQNIYITSDEEIKEWDWMIRDNEQPTLVTPNFFWDFGVRYYKIILTTDQELIKDGVQAIDDEFLEWFVNNPSCELIEVGKTNKLIDNYAEKDEDKWEVKYHIYIPKEEPDYTALLQPVGTKQETIEEAFKKYSEYLEDYENKNTYEHGFKDGAKWQQEQYTIEEQHVGHTINELDKEYIKGFNEGSAWQQERSYSQEEVIAFGEFIFKHSLLTHAKGVKNLFEQFKKK